MLEDSSLYILFCFGFCFVFCRIRLCVFDFAFTLCGTVGEAQALLLSIRGTTIFPHRQIQSKCSLTTSSCQCLRSVLISQQNGEMLTWHARWNVSFEYISHLHLGNSPTTKAWTESLPLDKLGRQTDQSDFLTTSSATFLVASHFCYNLSPSISRYLLKGRWYVRQCSNRLKVFL